MKKDLKRGLEAAGDRAQAIRTFFAQVRDSNGTVPEIDEFLSYLLSRENWLDGRSQKYKLKPRRESLLESPACEDVPGFAQTVSRQVGRTLDAETLLALVEESTGDQVLQLLARLEVEDWAADLPELPVEYSVHGGIGKYLSTLDPHLRSRAVTAITPFLSCLVGIRSAIAHNEGIVYVDTSIFNENAVHELAKETEVGQDGTKVVRVITQGNQESTWFDLDKLERSDVLINSVYDLTPLTGKPETDYLPIDLAELGETLGDIRNEFKLAFRHPRVFEQVQLDVVNYLFTGKSSPRLDKVHHISIDDEDEDFDDVIPVYGGSQGGTQPPAIVINHSQERKQKRSIREHLERDEDFCGMQKAIQGVRLESIVMEANNLTGEVNSFDRERVVGLLNLKLTHPNHPVIKRLRFLSLGVNLGSVNSYAEARRITPFDMPSSTFNQAVMHLREESSKGPRSTLESRWNRIVNKANSCVDQTVLIQGVTVAQHIIDRIKASEDAPRRLTDQDVMAMMFENIASLSNTELDKILRIFFREGIKVVPEKVIQTINSRFGIPRDNLDQFNLFSQTYGIESLDYLPIWFTEYTDPVKMLSSGTDVLGLEGEAKETLDLLATNNRVLVQDRTLYDYPQGGRSTTAQNRLLQGVAHAVVRGDCPEEMRNATFLEFVNGELVQRKLLELQYGEQFTKGLGDVDMGPKADLKEGMIKDMLRRAVNYNDNCVLVVRPASQLGQSVGEFERYLESILAYIEDFGIKVLVMSPQSGLELPKVALERQGQEELEERFKSERDRFQEIFRVSIPDDVIAHLCYELKTSCGANEDPIDVGVRIFNSAAIQTRSRNGDTMRMEDMVNACNFTFGRLTNEEEAAVKRDIARTKTTICKRIAGQRPQINQLMDLMEAHFTGLTDVNAPLTVMMPGPTGVGKTVTWEVVELENGVPAIILKGSDFQEKTAVNVLRGSDPGYEGESKGKLPRFLEDKMYSVVFLDEYEKFDPAVIEYLMEFIDKGRVQSGAGDVFWRPRTIIAAATNAGQFAMHEGMNEKELRDLLTQEISPGKPEIIARWREIIPYHALKAKDLSEAIATTIDNMPRVLPKLGKLGITTTADPDFLKLAFEECEEVCAFKSRGGSIGFGNTASVVDGRYVNMRGMNAKVSDLVRPLLLKADLNKGQTLKFSAGDNGEPILITSS